MNDAVITQLLKQELSGPPFDKNMSKDARSLRDRVYELAFKNGFPKDPNKRDRWITELRSEYDPLLFEMAVLYDHHERIIESVRKRTSKKFLDDNKHENSTGKERPDHEKGTKSRNASRIKGLDWLDIAKFQDWHDIWYRCIEYAKLTPTINPNKFLPTSAQFRPVYELFVDWVYSDFNRKSLVQIYRMSLNYSLEFIKECMEFVEDRRKRDAGYLLAIIEKEHAILRAELEENAEVHRMSKQIVDSIVDYVDHHEHVDWDELEKDFHNHLLNKEEMDKIKLS